MQAYARFFEGWSLSPFIDGFDSYSWPDCEKGEGFNMSKSQNHPIFTINPIGDILSRFDCIRKLYKQWKADKQIWLEKQKGAYGINDKNEQQPGSW